MRLIREGYYAITPAASSSSRSQASDEEERDEEEHLLELDILESFLRRRQFENQNDVKISLQAPKLLERGDDKHKKKGERERVKKKEE